MKFENKGKWLKEIRSIDPSSVVSKDGKYYHKVHGYEVELRDGKFHRANTKDNAQTRVINKSINDLAKSKDMNNGTYDNANIKELKALAELQSKMSILIDKLDQAKSEEEELKIKNAMKTLDNAIRAQKEIIKASHDAEIDKLRTRQIPKMMQSKKEDIDDDSTSVFGDDPLDDIDEDSEKVFVRNMSTGNAYYINQNNFDKNKHELIDDSQQSSTDTQATSLVFEIRDLKTKIKQLEQTAKQHKSSYDDAMRAIDSPYTNYKEIERNKQKASKINELYTVALDDLNRAKADLIKKQKALSSIKEQ